MQSGLVNDPCVFALFFNIGRAQGRIGEQLGKTDNRVEWRAQFVARVSEEILLAEGRFLGGGTGIIEFRLAMLGFRHVADDGDCVIDPLAFSGGGEVTAPARPHFEPKENRFGVISAIDTNGAPPAQSRADRDGARARVRNCL